MLNANNNNNNKKKKKFLDIYSGVFPAPPTGNSDADILYASFLDHAIQDIQDGRDSIFVDPITKKIDDAFIANCVNHIIDARGKTFNSYYERYEFAQKYFPGRKHVRPYVEKTRGPSMVIDNYLWEKKHHTAESSEWFFIGIKIVDVPIWNYTGYLVVWLGSENGNKFEDRALFEKKNEAIKFAKNKYDFEVYGTAEEYW